MFESFTGKLAEKNPTYAVIDCGGVAYHLHITLSTYTQLAVKEQCTLFAHLVVKEDAHVLYGFITKGERETFRMLINVSGVGAGTARMILSSLDASEFAEAVMTQNLFVLKGIKGIGEKTAQRILIDLKGKFDKHAETHPELFAGSHNMTRTEALSALTLLGFPRQVAEKGIEKVMKLNGTDMSVEDLIKQTLKVL